MYTILVTEDNELVVSVAERIMHRSSNVNTLHFLVDPLHGEMDMADFECTLEYVLPVSKEYETLSLVRSEELYKEKYEYKVNFAICNFTSEPGDVEVKLTFTKLEMDETGKVTEYVRKTSPALIHIIPITEWSNYVADAKFSSLDQRILELQALANEMADTATVLSADTVDDIMLTDNLLQVSIDGRPVGTGVEILVPAVEDDQDGTDDGIVDISEIINI